MQWLAYDPRRHLYVAHTLGDGDALMRCAANGARWDKSRFRISAGTTSRVLVPAPSNGGAIEQTMICTFARSARHSAEVLGVYSVAGDQEVVADDVAQQRATSDVAWEVAGHVDT